METNAGSITGRVVLDTKDWTGKVETVKRDAKEVSQTLKTELSEGSKKASEETEKLGESLGETAKATKVQASAASESADATRGQSSAAKSAGEQMGSAARGAATLKEKLKSLQSEVGEGSPMHKLSQILVGGGIVAGFGLLGRELNKVTTEAREMVTAFRSGEASVGELAEKMAGSIPVFGNFWTAGRNIREMLTGEQAALAAVNAEFERIGKLSGFFRGASAESKRFVGELRDVAREAKETARILALPPEQRAGAKAASDTESEIRAIRESLAERERQIEAEFGPKQRESGKRLGELQADVADRSDPGFISWRDFTPGVTDAETVLQQKRAELGSEKANYTMLNAARKKQTEDARKAAAAAIEAIRARQQAEIGEEARQSADQAAKEAARDAAKQIGFLRRQAGDSARGAGARGGGGVSVNAPPIDEQKLAAALRDQLIPVIDQRIRQASNAARAAATAAQVQGGL